MEALPEHLVAMYTRVQDSVCFTNGARSGRLLDQGRNLSQATEIHVLASAITRRGALYAWNALDTDQLQDLNHSIQSLCLDDSGCLAIISLDHFLNRDWAAHTSFM